MPAIIRLSRHGKKGQPFYHIVVADSRYARDARFVEKIGTYNPRTSPATVNIKFDRAVDWVQKGAKPSDTTRTILSAQGIMFKAHLQRGVTKGVFTQEQADVKFNKWVTEKETSINTKKSTLEVSKKEAYKKRIAAESVSRESRNAKRREKEAANAQAATNAPESANGDQPTTPPAAE